MATTQAAAKSALKRAETSTKKAVQEVKKAEVAVARTATPAKAAVKHAPTKSAPAVKKAAPVAKAAPAKSAGKAKPAAATAAPGTVAKAVQAGKAAEVKAVVRHMKPVVAQTLQANLKKQGATKLPDPAATSRPSVKVVKKSGPQVKSRTVVQSVPVADATSEHVADVVTQHRPLVSATSHNLDRRALMTDLSGQTRSAPAAAPAPVVNPPVAAIVQGTSAQAEVPQGQQPQPTPTRAPAPQSADINLRSAHDILHTPAPPPPVAPRVEGYQSKTHWRTDHGNHPSTLSHVNTGAPQGLQRNVEVPHGMQALSNSYAPASTPAAQTLPPHVDGQPATSENTRAETAPVQAQWKSALAGGPAWPRSAVAGGMGHAGSPARSPATTGHSPALIERRFEVYQEGLSAWRWRLVAASTGSVLAYSKTTFGTPGEAENSAHTESGLHKAGTSLVTRVQPGARY